MWTSNLYFFNFIDITINLFGFFKILLVQTFYIKNLTETNFYLTCVEKDLYLRLKLVF